ncbi:tubulin polyglutamylase ttll-4 [Ditylenchus destructor]|uniref:Tubulin polyglutamylase ttll-4 n=1 Tax=Ditylenchus destructor TaxID=166010 RepID=A0AAD4MK52_9BILA|nr:tubulin polyglutamylase ttll-4 [Ditylenchus destructor]
MTAKKLKLTPIRLKSMLNISRITKLFLLTLKADPSLLEDLTPSGWLVQLEDELTRLGDYEPLFPLGKDTEQYLSFLDPENVYPNVLYSEWQKRYGSKKSRGNSRLQDECARNRHLMPSGKYEESPMVGDKKKKHSRIGLSSLLPSKKPKTGSQSSN